MRILDAEKVAFWSRKLRNHDNVTIVADDNTENETWSLDTKLTFLDTGPICNHAAVGALIILMHPSAAMSHLQTLFA